MIKSTRIWATAKTRSISHFMYDLDCSIRMVKRCIFLLRLQGFYFFLGQMFLLFKKHEKVGLTNKGIPSCAKFVPILKQVVFMWVVGTFLFEEARAEALTSKLKIIFLTSLPAALLLFIFER